MKCPFCGFEESKVIDSRPTDEGQRIRRRRECLQCQKRFTTYEIIESLPIIVIKKDKSRETFNRDKLMTGLLRACEKRPVSFDTLDNIEKTFDSFISPLFIVNEAESSNSPFGIVLLVASGVFGIACVVILITIIRDVKKEKVSEESIENDN